MVARPKLIKSNLDQAQVRAVLHTISYPGFEASDNDVTPLPKPTLATLSRLHIHFLLAFPFEALAMNYEPHATMDAALSHTYSRFVEKRRGGGYCLQVNLLYREVLAFLGFRFIGVLGRVYSPMTQDWTGLTHTATLVYLPSHVEADQGKKVYYLSDVGFGSSPHRPILLRDEWEEYGRGTDKYRLVQQILQPRSTLEDSSSDDEKHIDEQMQVIANSQRVWKLQNQKNGKPQWEDCYSFSLFECFNPDYQASNKATSHPASVPFATMILVVRYLLNPELLPKSEMLLKQDDGTLHPDLYPYHPSVIEQRMIVNDKHIVKIGDDQTTFRTIQSERERVQLLKSDFNLLQHVDTEQALQEISTKPSKLATTKQVNGDA